MADILMDGAVVVVGDRVHDTAFGAGVVTETRIDHRFVVLFGGNRRAVYSGTGHTRELVARTLFWHDPAIVPPPKDAVRWSRTQRLIQVILQELQLL